jgi:hypothetical protein
MTEALRPFVASTGQKLVSRVLRKLNVMPKFDSETYPHHIKASELMDAIGKEVYESYFSFSFVRNPWDWQVSLYKYGLSNTELRQHELIKGFGSFDKYIRWRCAEEVRLQKDFIYSAEGELLVDFVGRYETIDADFKTICSRIGISASLPKLNVSNTEPYQQFYNEETRDLVKRTFDADITLFGYEFENQL